jgi:hypothetical protein
MVGRADPRIITVRKRATRSAPLDAFAIHLAKLFEKLGARDGQ